MIKLRNTHQLHFMKMMGFAGSTHPTSMEDKSEHRSPDERSDIRTGFQNVPQPRSRCAHARLLARLIATAASPDGAKRNPDWLPNVPHPHVAALMRATCSPHRHSKRSRMERSEIRDWLPNVPHPHVAALMRATCSPHRNSKRSPDGAKRIRDWLRTYRTRMSAALMRATCSPHRTASVSRMSEAKSGTGFRRPHPACRCAHAGYCSLIATASVARMSEAKSGITRHRPGLRSRSIRATALSRSLGCCAARRTCGVVRCDPGSIVPLDLPVVPALRSSAKGAATASGTRTNCSRAVLVIARRAVCRRGCRSLFISDFPKNIVPSDPNRSRLSHPTPPEGRIMIVTDAGEGCGGRSSVGRAMASAGRIALRERLAACKTTALLAER